MFDFEEQLARQRSVRRVLAEEAQRVLPPVVWNYYRAGRLDETASDEALNSWDDVRFAPLSLTSVKDVDAVTELFGYQFSAPFGFAPSSLQRFAAPEGELAMAEVTRDLNLPYTVSSNAGHSFAEIAEVNPNWWCQTYITQRREDSIPMVERALEAGARALVLTVDAPVIGRKYDVGNNDWAGLAMPWHRINYAGLAGEAPRGGWAADLRAEDVHWLKELSQLPIIAKGVMHPASVQPLLDAGVDALWVSNHGGRQHSRALTTRLALPHIRAQAARTPILVDGGLYAGADVASAIALGADLAMAGRLPLYALAAGGKDLLRQVTELTLEDFRETVKLSGVARASELAKTVIA